VNLIEVVVDVLEGSKRDGGEVLEVSLVVGERRVHKNIGDLLTSSGEEGG